MKLWHKIVGGFSIILALMIGLSFYQKNQATNVIEHFDSIVENDMVALDNLLESEIKLGQLQQYEKSILIYKGDLLKELFTNIEKTISDLDKYLAIYGGMNHTSEEAAQWKNFSATYLKWKEAYKSFVNHVEKNPTSSDNYDRLLSLRPFALAMDKDFDQLINTIRNQAKTSGKATDDLTDLTNRNVFIVLGLTILIVVVLSFFVTRNVGKIINALIEEMDYLARAGNAGDLSKRGDLGKINFEFQPIVKGVNDTLNAIIMPIQEAVVVMEKLSTGDLTLKMKGEYQGDYGILKKSINGTIDSMLESLSFVATSVQQIDSGASQVAIASQGLSQGATESASSLEEITSSMNEIGGQTKNNAQNASQAQRLSEEAKHRAELGNSQMEKMIDAMDGINKSSESISRIIKVIDEIAFQTNLLALNAAVEAARAGKHGKGFAVVAEEVRNLAARSANAAKETTEMIDDSSKKVSAGAMITQETAKALEEIVNSTKRVTDLVGEISNASNEQAQGVSQIVTALGQIDQVTQRNTASAEESAAAAEELSGQAAQLKAVVQRFKLN